MVVAKTCVTRGGYGLWRCLAVLCVATSAAACSLVIKDPFAAFAGAPIASGDVISRQAALDDLDFLMGTLERVHPDPYRFRSREVVDAERRRVAETMPASLTTRDLCLRLGRVLAALDDGHTGIDCVRLMRDEWRRAAGASPPETQRLLMFPPFMRLDDQQHLVVGWPNGAPGLLPGDRILRINGQDADALLASWASEVSSDTEAARRASVARRFRLHLALHGIEPPYRLTVAAPVAPSREVIIEGEPVNYQFQERPPAPNLVIDPFPVRPQTVLKPIQLENGFFTYRLIEPDIAYMNFSSILDGLSTVSRFRKAVDAMFRLVAADKPRVLIIDVRENGGGEDTAATVLLRHITAKPFRLLASTQIKRSQEARDFGSSLIRVPFRWMRLQYLSSEGRQYFTGTIGTLTPPTEFPVRTWPRAEPFYAGPVCVLTGPHTFSAAAELAGAVKAFGLATIVGEETGGQPNSFGNALPFTLPRSKLLVEIATARAVRASGDVNDVGPVMPDIVVRATAEDIRAAGFDPVLERAKNCPERTIRQPAAPPRLAPD